MDKPNEVMFYSPVISEWLKQKNRNRYSPTVEVTIPHSLS